MAAITTIIKSVCEGKKYCGTFATGDVFLVTNRPNIKYPILCLDIASAITDTADNTLSMQLYYIDRELPDGENRYDIQLDSVQFLSEILCDISEQLSIITPCNITPFVQKFLDECSGSVLDFQIKTYNNV